VGEVTQSIAATSVRLNIALGLIETCGHWMSLAPYWPEAPATLMSCPLHLLRMVK
jgi:hypothetical protein